MSIIPVKGKFNPANVKTNLVKANQGFNFSNVPTQMNKMGQSGCNHKWINQSMIVRRNGFGAAEKRVVFKCMTCGATKSSKDSYADTRVLR